MSNFAENLTAARKKANISKVELARRVGLTRAAISSMECGRQKYPSPPNLFKIAEVLGCDPKWLAGESDNSKFSEPKRDDLLLKIDALSKKLKDATKELNDVRAAILKKTQ